MMAKTAKRALLGFLIYALGCSAIAFCVSQGTSPETPLVTEALLRRIGSPAAAISVQALLSGIFGAACIGGIGFYEVEEWSVLRATTSHLALCAGAFIPTSLYLGWLPADAPAIILCMLGFAVAYGVIWLVMYLHYKRLTRELNELLETSEETHGRA